MGSVERPERFHARARFEGYELDLRAGELRREGGKIVRLSEQPFQILRLLLEHPGEVVTREEIRKKLWPNDTIVEFEHSISAAMNRLRQALGDSAENPHFVETLAGRGYRWMVPVQWVAPAPADPTVAVAPVSLPEAKAPTENLIGKTVSHYHVLQTLGGGGMGVVYKAEDSELGRLVALKFLPRELTTDPKALSRFQREARTASALSHPNICSIYEVAKYEGLPFIAMELVEGVSLAAKIQELRNARDEGSWNTKDRAAHARQMVTLFVGVADALQHVHEQDVIHRDIKPLNLLLTKDRARLLLTDFGVARDAQSSSLTLEGDLLGTIHYMSPEQLLAQRIKVDHRSDIWSLGVSLYEAITLELPYTGKTTESYIASVSMKEPTPASSQEPAVPRDLETILMKCLQRDRERRYTSAAALKEDLVRFLEDRPVLARRPGPITKSVHFVRRHWMSVFALCTLALVLAVGGLLSVRFRHRRDLDRLRWTLNQVIVSQDALPEKLQPDWPYLRDLLRREVRRQPHGDLAVLGQRASVRDAVRTPTFGLVSKWTGIDVMAHDDVIGLDQDCLTIARIEGAWDGGPWTIIGGSQRYRYDKTAYTSTWSPRPADTQTEGPHQIQVRERIRYFDPAGLPPSIVKHFSEEPTQVDELRDRLEQFSPGALVYTETRSLPTVSVSLYREYAPDFPRAIPASPAAGEPASWFHVDRLVIRRVVLPLGQASGFQVQWPDEKRSLVYCFEGLFDSAESPLIRVKIVGPKFELNAVHVPIAAQATLRAGSDSKPMLSFPLSADSEGWIIPQGTGSWGSSWSDTPPAVWFDLGPSCRSCRIGGIWNRPGGAQTGSLDLVPSREVAIAIERYNRYLGQPFSIPIPNIEIVTVPGQWVNKKGCQQP